MLSTKDIAEGAIYRKTGTIVEVDHPILGVHETLGSAFHLSDSPVEVLPSPTLGQHTEETYRNLLHMTPAQIAALKEEGVI